MFDLWEPPKPAVIIPAPKELLLPPMLGLTMMARTWAIRLPRRAASAGVITFVDSATGSSSDGTDLTVTLPGTTAANDIVIAMSQSHSGDTTDSGTVSTSGYTNVVDLNYGTNRRTRAYWKAMGGSPDASVTFNGTDNSIRGLAGVVLVFRGVNTSTPIDATTTTATGVGGAPDCPSITPTNNNCAIVACAGSDGLDATFSAPTNYSTPVFTSVDVSIDAQMAASYRILVGGAGSPENPSSFTGWGAANWGAGTIALRPA